MSSDSTGVAAGPADFETSNRSALLEDAYKRIAPLGWKSAIPLIIALLIASFFCAGYFSAWWRHADMDIFVIYNAFLVNDGRPQLYFDHPAYFTILTVRGWFELLHRFGQLEAWNLSSVSSLDPTAFNAAMTGAVRAARVLSLSIALVVVLVFAGLARAVLRESYVAMFATIAFASSGALAMQMRIVRTELIAAPLVVFGFLILILAARRASSWRPFALGLVACMCVLGLENKVHVILLIAALPLMILPFGSAAAASTSFWSDNPRRWLAVTVGAVVAALMLSMSFSLISVGFDPKAMAATEPPLKPVAGVPGVYQTALIFWVGSLMVAFSRLWKISVAECIAAMLAVLAGACLALLALKISYYDDNVVTTLNPIERMLSFADLSGSKEGGLFSVAKLFVLDVARVFLRYTFFLSSSPRPAVFLTWLVFPGIVYAWHRGERQAATQAAALMLSALAIDSVGMRRGLKDEYFIFTDPLIILAGAVLLDRFNEFRFHRWTYPIGLGLIVAHIVVGQAEPAKHLLSRKGPEGMCEWRSYYAPLLPMYWCKA